MPDQVRHDSRGLTRSPCDAAIAGARDSTIEKPADNKATAAAVHRISEMPPQALRHDDLEAAQALVVEAGWNQLREDWELFVQLGSAFKVTTADGAIAATAATLPYPGGFGWISMVLVAQAHRRQGLATTLLAHCIEQLRRDALVPVLDATPAGRTVYGPIGFQDGWAITRWRRAGSGPALPRSETGAVVARPLRQEDWPRLLELDARAFGTNRAPLLACLAQRSAAFACVAERDGRLLGYLLGRNGRLATQIGPVAADDAAAAAALVAHALERIPGPVLIDVVDRHRGFARQLADAGFAIERGYTRMTLGVGAPFGNEQLTVAIAGPELG
ncbi:MAG TPA: GNAT family N-acetyltransferase [Ramlibacter sp.]|nr:GNAT family N-acetyltransferase [Ramlibacter sp.]